LKYDDIPVITIDGPGGVGKGTLSQQLASHLKWHFLESGALYRVLALAAQNHSVSLENHQALARLAQHLDVVFEDNPNRVVLEGQNITKSLRHESCGQAASIVAAIPSVREALLVRQRAFLQSPGLIADGRDMGTVIFPDAPLKIYLEASPEIRAKRRQMQLKEQGIDVSLESLLTEINERDARDMSRAVAPLKPAQDAVIIDTSHLRIVDVFEQVLDEAKRKGLF
jgi:cytidylate kinase